MGTQKEDLRVDADGWLEIQQSAFEKVEEGQQTDSSDKLRVINFKEKKCTEFFNIMFQGKEKFTLRFRDIEHLIFRNCKFQEFDKGVMTAERIGQMEFLNCTFEKCIRKEDVMDVVPILYVGNFLALGDKKLLKDYGVVARLRDVGYLKLCQTHFYDCYVLYYTYGNHFEKDDKYNMQFTGIGYDDVEFDALCIRENSCPIVAR